MFDGSVFSGRADFHETVFSGFALFAGTTFKNRADFQSSQYDGLTFIDETTFQGEAVYYNAIFHGDTFFDNSTFQGDALFIDATFYNDVSFVNAKIEGVMDISGSEFKKRFSIDGATYSSINMENISCNTGLMDLHWSWIEGKIVGSDNRNRDKNGTRYTKASESVMLQYKYISDILRSKGRHEDADRAFYLSKKVEGKLARSKGEKLKNLMQDIIWGYGTKPMNTIFAGAVIILLFACCYLPNNAISCSHGKQGDKIDKWERIVNALYYSANTFTTVGTGDFYPNGKWRMISTFEGFLGYIIMALFIISLSITLLR